MCIYPKNFFSLLKFLKKYANANDEFFSVYCGTFELWKDTYEWARFFHYSVRYVTIVGDLLLKTVYTIWDTQLLKLKSHASEIYLCLKFSA